MLGPTLRQFAPAVGFGTSGVRALVADLTAPVVCAYVRAFAERVRNEASGAPCVVGWDLRPSSPDIAAAVCAGLDLAGMAPLLEGPCPTPALALRACDLGAPAIVITGSHIPFDRNGVKFYTPRGEITKGDEVAISSTDVSPLLPQEPDFTGRLARWAAVIAAHESGRAASQYAERLMSVVGSGALAGMRVGVYQHSAVGRDLLAALLRDCGADVIALARSDSFVPIDTEAVSRDDELQASAWCAEHGLDAVVSTDGDGDRPWICDERGALLRGDLVGVLCAMRLGADAVVTPVSSNTALEKCGAFRKIVRTRIGSPFVIEAMEALAKEGWSRVAGYEANGGFLTQTPFALEGGELSALPTRDSGLPILIVLKMARERNLPLSRLADLLPARRTASGSVKGVDVAQSAAFLAAIRADPNALADFLAFTDARPASADNTDGLRVELSSGDIVHLRPSGNAPEFRCYVEASTQEHADTLLEQALRSISSRFLTG